MSDTGPAPAAPDLTALLVSAPARRDETLLSRALDALQRGAHGDALLAAEAVCRRQPQHSLPALLRARIVQACLPQLGAQACYHAWRRAPTDTTLQDILLQAWLTAGADAAVTKLGPAFLPQRCRQQQAASLLGLLHQAGVGWTGACWREGERIAGRVFAPAAAATPARVRLLLNDEQHHYQADVAADGSLFHLDCPRAGAVWSLTLTPADAAPVLLPGSPLAFYPEPLAPSAAILSPHAPRPVALIIPVYAGMAATQACMTSVLASLTSNRSATTVLVIDDASPEPALSAWLDTLANAGSITLLRNRSNLGFIESCNRGLRQLPQHEALLLNADTLVHGDWIDRMLATLYTRDDVAAVCPWSNNGEISSFPRIGHAAPMPDAAQLAALDRRAAAVHAASHSAPLELLSCCGFAMLMRRSAIDHVGLLDGAGLQRGYGEEVDWCLRASAAGYRHLLASGVFVAHAGGASFGMEKTLRVQQNRAVLQARYPDYYPAYRRLLHTDPLAAARQALFAALDGDRWLALAQQQQQAHPSTPPSLPAALPSASARIAVSSTAAALPGVLTLARQLAGRPSLQLRLLVLGDASEALWRTGVVDALPAPAEPLLSDSTLAGLGGCIAALDAGVPIALPLPRDAVDAHFDASAYLDRWQQRHASLAAA